MIQSYANKGLRRYAEHNDASKLSVPNRKRLDRMLRALDAAEDPDDLSVPGWGFHQLKGRRSGTYSLTVSGNWRLTFSWDGGPCKLDLEDYH